MLTKFNIMVSIRQISRTSMEFASAPSSIGCYLCQSLEGWQDGVEWDVSHHALKNTTITNNC